MDEGGANTSVMKDHYVAHHGSEHLPLGVPPSIYREVGKSSMKTRSIHHKLRSKDGVEFIQLERAKTSSDRQDVSANVSCALSSPGRF